MSDLSKLRADTILVERGLAKTKSKAKSLIMSGEVVADNVKVEKPGSLLKKNSNIYIKKPDHPWVSRGGIKLNYALQQFNLNVKGMTALDIGASTGGFTDVLLNRGVAMVFAIDVGYGQLAWELRKNGRVKVLERQNARYLNESHINSSINLIVCDASFISLVKILPPALKMAVTNSILIALIKPQFEVSKKTVSKGGVVLDPEIHIQVCKNITNWLDKEMHWSILGLIESPIKGPAGNKEFFVAAKKS